MKIREFRHISPILLNKYKVLLLSMGNFLFSSLGKDLVMKKATLGIVLSMSTLSSHAVVTVTDNPFYSDVEVNYSLFVEGSGSSQCKGLPRTCTQMASCEQAKQALKCGNKRLDRDKDGVPCESICPGG